ncbi:MAG: hypothetical protein WAS21_17015 [Geminicoccaceae bacterium]
MAPSADSGLPPAAGWSWHILRGDEVRLVWPVVLIVDGQDCGSWISEAGAWIAAQGRQGGIAVVRCGFGTICGLFLYAVQAHDEHAVLHVERLLGVDLFGSNRTLVALLRAVRDLAEIHACRLARLRPPPLSEPGSAAVVAGRLGYVIGPSYWHLELPASLHDGGDLLNSTPSTRG